MYREKFSNINDNKEFFSPQCRVKVTGKKKNVVINGILEAFLKAYPNKRPVLKPIDNSKQQIRTTTNTQNQVC